MRVLWTVAAVAVLWSCGRAMGADMVPFVIPTTQNEKSLIAFTPKPIEPNAQRVVARDGHFWDGNERLRVWGVNLCFAANFPTHADAERVAARLAAFGINSVRFHHMDAHSFPRGIWDAKDPMKLSPEALDRLDYFIGQLARRGIYSNINLHVSRAHSRFLKLPDTSSLASFDKMLDIFTPELIDAQKKYARDLLTHVNPYRRLRLADDPAVAFVEINNEDSLFMWGWENKLRNLPEFYAKVLRGRYNEWLAKRYVSADALAKAWSAGAMPLGENLLSPMRSLAPGGKQSPNTWNLELHAPAKATAAALAGDANAVRIEVPTMDDTYWHIQFRQFGLTLKSEQYYTLSFRARADKPREVSVGVGQHQDPWGSLGLGQAAKLTAEWKVFRLGFVAKADEKNARLSFTLGQSAGAVELADVELRPGGKEGLGKAEDPKAGTVALFGAGETEARTIGRMRFLAETEKAYFDSMREYVKKDLGCKALVAGTIVFGPLGLWAQSDMDYIDGHAYWQHPRFPRKPWDAADWTVEQTAMVDHPDKSTLYHLAAQRLAGKPYTVSEYNHPAPNDYQAECVPMIASFAAAQDWDGVWLFAYNHSADWDRQAYAGFFDINANPAKWGFVPAGAAILRGPDAGPWRHTNTMSLSREEDPLNGLCTAQIMHGSNMGAAAGLYPFGEGSHPEDRVYVRLSGQGEGFKNSRFSAMWNWDRAEANATGRNLEVRDDSLFVAQIGHVPKDQTGRLFHCDRPGFAVFVMSSLDGSSLGESNRVLITACGRCENTDMKFTPDRRSVGRNWGKAPVQIEPVEGVLSLLSLTLAKQGKWQCRALKPDGTAGEEVPVTPGKGGEPPSITLAAKYKTMWYLLTRE